MRGLALDRARGRGWRGTQERDGEVRAVQRCSLLVDQYDDQRLDRDRPPRVGESRDGVPDDGEVAVALRRDQSA
jgi:hypothetical protein